MILNFKHSLAVMIFFCFITITLHAQTPDTLKVATAQEKSETIARRMENELSLTKEQASKVMTVLTERFQTLEKSGSGQASLLETANQKTLQKLSVILNNEQYVLYQELRTKKKQARDKYLKDHPGFAFSKEDLEMDF